MEGGRQRWTERGPRRKEPSLYDEWLADEKKQQASHASRAAHNHHHHNNNNTATAASGSTVSSLLDDYSGEGDTASAAGATPTPHTVRAVTPESSAASAHSSLAGGRAAGAGADNGSGRFGNNVEEDDREAFVVGARETTSFERHFLPHNTTTIVGGPAAHAFSSPGAFEAGSSPPDRNRTLRKRRDWDRGAGSGGSGSRGSRNVAPLHSGMLGRSGSRNNGGGGREEPMSAREAFNAAARPRTRTLDDNKTAVRDRSPGSLLVRSRKRIGSVNTPGSPSNYHGAEYLASVPAATSPPSAPSISSLGSPVQPPSEVGPGRRSISPVSSSAAESITSTLPTANARRILHLMKTLQGRMSGKIMFRRGAGAPWSLGYCYIHEEAGSLLYEPKGGDDSHKTLIPDLRGCSVKLENDGETPYLDVSLPRSTLEVHIKLLSQGDFDSWFAALLCWQPIPPKGQANKNPHLQPSAVAAAPTPPEPPPRVSSQHASTRGRADSERSGRSKGVKEAPVIKIGKMIYWDTNISYSNAPNAGSMGLPGTGRPQAYRMQSHGSRRWRRISGQLRENGELKLYSDADHNLVSVVQLSQLSRCAIQRLDPSVLDNDFCIAVYPQYTSNAAGSTTLLRPIFLSLESRVLYEVWFVLLRAFTIPQLYGPRASSPDDENGISESGQDVENMLATSTTDMFRMERSLSIRVVEAKLYPPPTADPSASPDSGFSGGHSRAVGGSKETRPEHYGHHVEVLLDNETRGKTVVKFEGLTPLWGESFEFLDLPAVLTSASVVIKRRGPEATQAREQHASRLVHEAYGFSGDPNGGYSGITFDVTVGKVEIYLDELEAAKEVEKWWPVANMYGQRVGEILIKARAEEGVILMARDYQPLCDLLHRFSNGLTLQLAQLVPSELKRLSDCLLNIFQVSGTVADWLTALVEDEIDGISKEATSTPLSRLRYSRVRMGSTESGDTPSPSDRELLVRDMNKNATLEANLLFRGNTLLTKSLDSHMRRVGREYLALSLSAPLNAIASSDPDCEVDPNRGLSQAEVERNWRRLLSLTEGVWKSILVAKHKCPVELRVVFRHIRACAEDRYGDYLRSVSYSSVSGFLFLRFFCPAVLNPVLFGLVKDEIKPRARRTFTLIAKSLQTLANMASFGTKEIWMEPMNSFLTNNRESFKGFVDDICYVPTPLSSTGGGNYSTSTTATSSTASSPTHPVSAEINLSYTTPMTIMQRLPPTSREGFPSLPYLIDQARNFADLVSLWLEATSASGESNQSSDSPMPRQQNAPSVASSIRTSDGDLSTFHELCVSLDARTQESLRRAERAERPNSALSFRWEEVIDQLQQPDVSSPTEGNGGHSWDNSNGAREPVLDTVTEQIATNPTFVPRAEAPNLSAAEEAALQLRRNDPHNLDSDDEPHRADDNDNNDPARPHRRVLYSPNTTPTLSSPQHDAPLTRSRASIDAPSTRIHPTRSLRHHHFPSNPHHHSRHSETDTLPSPTLSASASASASAVSSTVSSDAEAATTALPDYEREVRRELQLERERGGGGVRSGSKFGLVGGGKGDRERDKEKEKEKRRKVVKREQENEGVVSGGGGGGEGFKVSGLVGFGKRRKERGKEREKDKGKERDRDKGGGYQSYG